MKTDTVYSLGKLLRSAEETALSLTEKSLAKIKERNEEIGAFITVLEESALKSAREFDALNETEKWRSPLSGIPVAIKDNLTVKGVKCTCGSKMLEDFISPYDATAVVKLKNAGAIVIGKTNMDEFGMGSTGENSAFYPTVNPHDPSRAAGGSSSGSCAAVASGMVPMALGSDTGGSVRLPACHCGVVGLRPTYGAVSRFGLTAFSSSMDTVGPITKTVGDNAAVYKAIAGKDPQDATSRGFDFSVMGKISDLKIGILSELMGEGIRAEVKNAVKDAANKFASLGASVEYVSVPEIRGALAAYYIISSAQASSNLARFDGVRYGHRTKECGNIEELYQKSREEGFGKEVKRRILLGTYALTKENKEAYYERSMLYKKKLCMALEGTFLQYDILLCPTAPDVAPLVGQFKTPEEMYATDLCTVPMSLAGLPALCMPCGKNERGLPIGMQLVGRPFSEGLLYAAGMLYEGSVEDGTV